MRLVFLSNYFNHHQKPISDCFFDFLGQDYCFIETSDISEERKRMGWGFDKYPSYVIKMNSSNRDACQKMIDCADIVVFGSADEKFLHKRKKENKIIFRYSERPLKKGDEPLKFLPRFIKWHLLNPRKKNIFLLSASAYAHDDYAKFKLFKGKSFRWGYFPEIVEYSDFDALIRNKKHNSILWAGRLIDWKHPELAIEVAKQLKTYGYHFELNIIGVGAMSNWIIESIKKEGLNDCVHYIGAKKPNEVRKYMEESQIFLFTSDRNEGWGAVLNESMNSGCAVVANKAAGSAPFLIENMKDGLLYDENNCRTIVLLVSQLLDDKNYRESLSQNAYLKIRNEWSPRVAAERFLALSKNVLKGLDLNMYSNGPCSKEW